MTNKPFRRYYLFSFLGILIGSYYPLSMGVQVILDMLNNGVVLKENYPKYIIPYTPICVGIILGFLIMPLCIRILKKYAFPVGASAAVGVFFASEFLFEQKVVVSTAETVTKLEDWQMFMCYMPPEGWGSPITTYKTQTPVEILMGNYDPGFKLHFYLISVVLIITILNCLYGFGLSFKTGEKKRVKALILQSVCSILFLGLCILACFTAFWRDGSIQVSPLSAILMSAFFILFGITVGVFTGSFLLDNKPAFSVILPAIAASVMTCTMYIGEMILLNGHLYQLGTGFLFESIPGLVLAPMDLLMIAGAGGITALTLFSLNRSQRCSKNGNLLLKKLFTVGVLVIAAALAAISARSLLGDKQCLSDNCVTTPEVVYTTVRVLETDSNEEFSSYQVGADLPSTDFSSIGSLLADQITGEWSSYDSLTTEQRLVSSKLWGFVSIETDTWAECEKAIGFTIHNPLEKMDWLNQTEHLGMESSDAVAPAGHVQVTANTSQNTDRTISTIHATAGYYLGNVRITLTATLWGNTAPYTTINSCNGYAVYEEKNFISGSGNPVLVVITNETNNTGYYNADYFDPTAYWVRDNVFYTLRLFGEETQKSEIQAAMDRILAEI